jgi:hypothetical protein
VAEFLTDFGRRQVDAVVHAKYVARWVLRLVGAAGSIWLVGPPAAKETRYAHIERQRRAQAPEPPMTLKDELQQLTADVAAAARIALARSDLEIAARLVNAHTALWLVAERSGDSVRTREVRIEAEKALRDWRRGHGLP